MLTHARLSYPNLETRDPSPPATPRAAHEPLQTIPPWAEATIDAKPRPLAPRTFADRYIQIYGIAPEDFENSLLARVRYRAANMLQPPLGWCDRRGEAVDREFVARIGRIMHPRDFLMERADFTDDPANRTFLRRRLRLRVSVKRMQDVVYEVMIRRSAD